MPCITKIRSNLKVGCDVEIGPKTIIVGPNGSGKSTIINAVELALTGRAGDIAGRAEVAREADVMSLAPAGMTDLESIVSFDDGMVAAYRTSGSTAKAKKASGDKPMFVRHEEVLPIRSLREAVLGSPQTARKYLLSKVSGTTTRADVRALLPAETQALWDTVAATFDAATPVTDVLVGVLESAGSRMRDANAEAKTARGAAKTVGDGFAAPPTDAEIAAAKAAVKAAREEYAKAEVATTVAARLASAKAMLATAEAEAEQKAQAFQKAKAASDALPAMPENSAPLATLSEVMRQSVAAGECLPCGGATTGITDRLAEVEAVIRDTLALREQHVRLSYEVTRTRIECERAINALENMEAEVAQLSGLSVSTPASAVEEATEALDAAQKKLSTLTSTRDNWAIVQRAEANAVAAEKRAGEWKALKDACEDAVAVVLDRALAAFIQKVQANLPKEDKFDLRLRDGEREVVQFGLVSGDGKLRTALSGAEWSRVMAAMASACVGANDFAVIIPEERAFDPKTLSSVLKSLTNCPHQVIMASPVAPKPLPKGWTLIERGAKE